MELKQARKRAEELRVIIEKNNRLYYDQDAPELEDFEYDAPVSYTHLTLPTIYSV